ncbi:MAG: periplasmic binding domain protein [Hyphomicrobiales bacterium]|nr:periplasmic binding domain protein [Hyphomicrobiales bacterium]
MSRLQIGAAVAGGLSLALVAGAVQAKQNSCDDPIVIGTTISMTGPLASLTTGWDRVTEALAAEINKPGGIMMSSCKKRVPIKFVIYDDQGNPATAISLHEKMATVDNVDVFAGVDWSFVVGPVSNISEKYKIPLIGGNVATPALFERGLKYFWATPFPMTFNWDANFADMMKNVDPKPKTIFWVTQDNPVYKSVQEIWMKKHEAAGIKTVGAEIFPNDLKDFSSIVLKIRAAKPDVVYINSFDNVAVPLVQQMRQMRIKAMDVHFPIASAALQQQTQAYGGIEGMTSVASWIPGVKGDYNDMIQRVYTEAKLDLAATATNMPRFTAYLVMIQAIEKAGVVDREKIKDALFKGTFKGPNGDITFDETGAPDTKTLVTQIQDGKFTVVWPAASATSKLRWPSPTWQ